ncbi:sodium:proton antiporter [Psychrosphaera sp. F3M07]|uniref:Na+/H+ antiporter NhaC family protein n=1 Tax=Psychrosphaera sp. F3M07 TaxID=2841560 RepID=UPI001C081163|nr:Na+/H+ antiporter NhaC family protein [Psychrosphaera sp. F3M07]MBU2916796.1 sodium:proton antiporter [Psychrosphaera sp. F3M07]
MNEWLSVIPTIVAIGVVFWRKEVILALLLAVFSSELILVLHHQSILSSMPISTINTVEQIVNVFSSQDNTRLLMFSLLVGSLLAFMRYSGGVSAVVELCIKKGIAKTPRQAGLISYFTGCMIFIESNLSSLTAGILSRGLFDKFKMSRAKLAYIIDSTSAPICILVLLNGWGAYILGLLNQYDLPESSINILVGTVSLNFYALITLAVVLYTIISGKTYGPLKKSELQCQQTPLSEQTELDTLPTKARFMLLPLITMVVGMIGFMYWTGNGDIAQGSGSKSVLYATSSACLVAYITMIFSGSFTHHKLVNIAFKGMAELLPLVSIMLLSFALGASLNNLGTGHFIASLVAGNLPIFIIPAILFLCGGVISFTTGTSWGTFALLIPIGVPLIQTLDLHSALVISAILGGGVFGDHCSPISDTTAVSSVASGCDMLEHVQTQLPYALVCGAIAFVGYLIAGFLMLSV